MRVLAHLESPRSARTARSGTQLSASLTVPIMYWGTVDMPVERRETAVFLLGYLRRHHWGLIATAISLTGTAYAATGLAPNSVGTRQIQSHAVTLSKVSLGAQRALRGRVGPVGPPGRVGPVGPRGHVGAAGPAGPSDGYYASSITGISAGPSSQPATVTVPPGQYIATGGCTASQGNGTGQSISSLTFGTALATLNATPAGQTPTPPYQNEPGTSLSPLAVAPG